jgi:DsbC/DsbD-like thiol-disulfide interchange protein
LQKSAPRKSFFHVPMLAQPRPFDHRLFVVRFGFGLALCITALAAKSDPVSSARSQGEKAQMRLIAAAGGPSNYQVAAEIRLPPTAITYWREPGDAGVPPKFSVSGSENVTKADILFPAPQRIDEQGIEAFGYRGGVVFPIHVAARDLSQPVRLRLTINYAVCDNICLPEESSAELVLPEGPQQPNATITAAEAKVPVALSAETVAANISIMPDKTATDPTWLLAWKGEPAASDLFAEAPEGWAFETHRRPDGLFSIVAVEEPPSGAPARVPVRLTLTGTKAYDFTTLLDVPGRARPISTGEETTQAAPGTK